MIIHNFTLLRVYMIYNKCPTLIARYDVFLSEERLFRSLFLFLFSIPLTDEFPDDVILIVEFVSV